MLIALPLFPRSPSQTIFNSFIVSEEQEVVCSGRLPGVTYMKVNLLQAGIMTTAPLLTTLFFL